jgi:hypothetical protein
LNLTRSGYEGTEQTASGNYMALFSQEGELWAAVRYLRMRQLGHWMMGAFRIAGKSVTVSGSIGSDGLPINWDKLPVAAQMDPDKYGLVPLPYELQRSYWSNEDGWNDCGSMTAPLREWGIREFSPQRDLS